MQQIPKVAAKKREKLKKSAGKSELKSAGKPGGVRRIRQGGATCDAFDGNLLCYFLTIFRAKKANCCHSENHDKFPVLKEFKCWIKTGTFDLRDGQKPERTRESRDGALAQIERAHSQGGSGRTHSITVGMTGQSH